MACLAQAIDVDVIPRLARRLGLGNDPSVVGRLVTPSDLATFLDALLAGRLADGETLMAQLRARGASVEVVYLGLFMPTARRLGELWSDDRVDFAAVTVMLGHLQRWLRELSSAFSAERQAAPHAHRALFVQAAGEQHSFGLSMLAEFFRRAGWDVLGGIGGAGLDASERVRRESVDLVGFSVGSEPQLPWLLRHIEQVRAASLNRRIVVMVGGPLFDQHPELLAGVPADASSTSAPDALRLAEALVAERQSAA